MAKSRHLLIQSSAARARSRKDFFFFGSGAVHTTAPTGHDAVQFYWFVLLP